jgi:hypothetical protein
MYNIKFIRDSLGFDWVPIEFDLENIFNIAYNPTTEDVKLYILDKDQQILYKVDQNRSIKKQYRGSWISDDLITQFSNYLGINIIDSSLIIDTFEKQTIYFQVDKMVWTHYYNFFLKIMILLNIREQDLVIMINRINGKKINSIYQSFINRSISMIRVPLNSKDIKIYSRPFMYGNQFDFQPKTTNFFSNSFSSLENFEKYRSFTWIGSDLGSDRIMISSQKKDFC